MARMPKADLESLRPTEEELAEARGVIAQAAAPEKKTRAAMASMVHYLKTIGETDGKVATSRGEERLKYLNNCLVLQARDKHRQAVETVCSDLAVHWRRFS